MRCNGTEDHASGLPNTTPTSSSLSRRGSQLSVPQSLKAVTTGHPVSPAGSCAQTRGGWGLDTQALGASRWSMVMPSQPPAGGMQAQSSVIQGPSGETTVPWAAHVLWIGSAGSRDPAQPDHSTSVRAHGSPAVSGPGACAKCVQGVVCTHPRSIAMAKGVIK